MKWKSSSIQSLGFFAVIIVSAVAYGQQQSVPSSSPSTQGRRQQAVNSQGVISQGAASPQAGLQLPGMNQQGSSQVPLQAGIQLPGGLSVPSQGAGANQQNIQSSGAPFQPGQLGQPGNRQGGGMQNKPASEKVVMKIEEKGDGFLTVELRNVEIKDFLRVLANKYRLNFVIDKDVKGTITASFSHISREDALKTVLEEQNLIAVKDGDITKIKPNLVTKIFEVKYLEAAQLVFPAGRRSQFLEFLSQDGKAYLGSIPNSIMVEDYPKNLEKIGAYLQMIDRQKVTKVFRLKYLSAAELSGMGIAKQGGGTPASAGGNAAAPSGR